jgi:hypothetical protein
MDEFYEDYKRIEALLRSPGHTPLMLLLGERDEPARHKYVKDYFAQLAEPKTLLVLKGANHYLNTAQSLGLVVYDRAVARQLVDELVPWLSSVHDRDAVSPQESHAGKHR